MRLLTKIDSRCVLPTRQRRRSRILPWKERPRLKEKNNKPLGVETVKEAEGKATARRLKTVGRRKPRRKAAGFNNSTVRGSIGKTLAVNSNPMVRKRLDVGENPEKAALAPAAARIHGCWGIKSNSGAALTRSNLRLTPRTNGFLANRLRKTLRKMKAASSKNQLKVSA